MSQFLSDVYTAVCQVNPDLPGVRVLGLIADRLRLPSPLYVLLGLVDEPDRPERLCRWRLCPQVRDPSFVEALRIRSPELRSDLTRLCQFWPVTYIAAHYRVSRHWIQTALLLWQLTPYHSRVPSIKPAQESEFLKLSQSEQIRLLDQAFEQFGAATPAAISLGVTPEFYRGRTWEIGVRLSHPSGTIIREASGNIINPDQLPRPETRRLHPDDLTRIKASLDQYGSVQAYCEATGNKPARVYKWARRIKWDGLRTTHAQSVEELAQKVRQTLEQTDAPQTLRWWTSTLYPQLDTQTLWYQKVTRQALKAAGLRPVCKGYANWVWVS